MVLADTLFIIAVIICSLIVHEVMHGVAADKLGDPTARYAGRLTLNPLPHLDLFGSIILPILLSLTPGGFLFGWAKPVPYNPYNLFRAPSWGEAIVAGAGPASNLALALLAGLLIRLQIFPDIAGVLMYVVVINVSLMLLNLIPVPPLDGSKLVQGPKDKQLDIVMNGKPNTAMAAFGKQLSDVELAAVITFTRNTWSNKSGEAIQPSEIKALRK
jgi:Zn-dependent protease